MLPQKKALPDAAAKPIERTKGEGIYCRTKTINKKYNIYINSRTRGETMIELNKPYKAKELAVALGVSERTFRGRKTEIEEYLTKNYQ